MARVATRVQAVEGVQSIKLTHEGIVIIYDPKAVKVDKIAQAFQRQGLWVRP